MKTCCLSVASYTLTAMNDTNIIVSVYCMQLVHLHLHL